MNGVSDVSMLNGYPGGVTLFDYDGDGDLDVFVPTGGRGDVLLRNDGHGHFTDVADLAGVRGTAHSKGAVAADIDNDGDVDLLVTVIETRGDGKISNDARKIIYRNNGNGTFTDISKGSGIDYLGTTISAAFADVDNDGLVDLYLGNFPDFDTYVPVGPAHSAQPFPDNRLYRNNGDGTFTDITEASGTALDFPTWAVQFFDGDDDGLIDLFVAAEISPVHFFKNLGGGRFTEVSGAAGLTAVGDWMGLAFGDIDGDGALDLFATNVGISTYFQSLLLAPPQLRDGGTFFHALYRNAGGGRFVDVSDSFRLRTDYVPAPPDPELAKITPHNHGVNQLEFAWGTFFFDYDNDGWEDLYLDGNDGAGSFDTGPLATIDRGADPGRLLRNDHGRQFLDVSAAAGVTDVDDSGYILQAWGSAKGDLDGDGFEDFALINVPGENNYPRGGLRLYRNSATSRNHWLTLRLHGDGHADNRDGIGARVEVTSEGRTQVRVVTAGTSHASASSLWPHVGLGRATAAQVRVRWPSGRTQSLGTVAADQILDVTEQP